MGDLGGWGTLEAFRDAGGAGHLLMLIGWSTKGHGKVMRKEERRRKDYTLTELIWSRKMGKFLALKVPVR